jgi:hypothetical protein
MVLSAQARNQSQDEVMSCFVSDWGRHQCLDILLLTFGNDLEGKGAFVAPRANRTEQAKASGPSYSERSQL